jgi:PAS domain S-box-containing protein
MKSLSSILVIEDDKGLNHLIQKTLRREGYHTEGMFTGKEALSFITHNENVLLLLDCKLPDMTGKALIDGLVKKNIKIPFVIITGPGDEGIAIEMMKMGARDYMIKNARLIKTIPHVIKNVEKELFQEKKLAESEKALRLSEEKFYKVFRSSPTFITISTLKEGRFIDVNDTFLKATGYKREDVIGRTELELGIWMEPDVRDEVVKVLDQQGSIYNQEVRFLIEPENVLTVLYSAEKIFIEDKQCILAVMLDITERKRLENQLLHAQKMEAVGQLAGGIAHDFNNILAAIMNYAFLIKRKSNEHSLLQDGLEQIISLAEKGSEITKGLLAFSRKHIINPVPISLNDTIRSVEKLLTKFISEDIYLEFKLTDKNPVVMADSTQIEQVLINLATNARDAMPDGGNLCIKTDIVRLDNEFIREYGFGRAGTYALLSVSDSGIGIDSETKRKIFEPFFSTKEAGKGTGLGLAMIYGIVKQHGGYITVDSEPGMGATFNIYLPLVEAVVTHKKGMKFYNLSGKDETILVAEDSIAVRKSLKNILDEFGYHVIEASDGEEAVAKFKQNKDMIKLIVIDVIMPKKSGRKAYDEIKKINPEVKVIFTSGYTAAVTNKKEFNREDVNILLKPVLPDKFLKTIKEVLYGENRNSP